VTETLADICAHARWSYERGRDPVEYAETCVVQVHLDAHLTITTSRADTPASFPGYLLELTPDALARRIVGGLLDAGWVSPAGPESPVASEDGIGEQARTAYQLGVSPLGYAEHVLAGVFEVHLRLVQEITGAGLEAALRVTGEMSLASFSRCLVRLLMDAGWTPPALAPEPEP
jgi:hypothetical protein